MIPAVVGPLTGDALGGAELVGVVLSIPAVLLIVSEGGLPTDRSAVDGIRSGLLGCLCGRAVGPARAWSTVGSALDAGAMPAFLTQLGAVPFIIPLIARPVQPLAPVSSRREAASACWSA